MIMMNAKYAQPTELHCVNLTDVASGSVVG